MLYKRAYMEVQKLFMMHLLIIQKEVHMYVIYNCSKILYILKLYFISTIECTTYM